MTQIDIAPEIRRRIQEIYKGLPYVLVPFVLETIAAAMSLYMRTEQPIPHGDQRSTHLCALSE